MVADVAWAVIVPVSVTAWPLFVGLPVTVKVALPELSNFVGTVPRSLLFIATETASPGLPPDTVTELVPLPTISDLSEAMARLYWCNGIVM